MRFLSLLLILTLLASCNVLKPVNKEAATAIQAPPTWLEGPVYDPSTSPQSITTAPPMTSSPQPVQARTQVQRPIFANPDAQQQPQTYGSVPMTSEQTGKGYAPQTYNAQASAPSTYAAPAPNTAEAALAEVLNGAWVNSADSNEIVAFTPDHYQTYYKGELLVEEDMTYHSACPGDCNGGVEMEIACFTISGPGGTDCYGIIRLTPEVMELSMLGISTEPIIYLKQQ